MVAEYKTIDEQIEILKRKNILIKDELQAKSILLRDSYYNLIEGYEDIFIDIKNSKESGTEVYDEETYFEEIYAVYKFDRDLRNLMFKYISIIETHIKSYVSDVFSKKYGTQDYLRSENFEVYEGREGDFLKLVKTINDNVNKNLSLYPEIKKYKNQNGSMPFWMLSTFITFGSIVNFYRLMKAEDKQEIADILGMRHRELQNYLKTLNIVRNISAHGDALFNVRFNIKYEYTYPDRFHEDFGIASQEKFYKGGINDMAAVIIILRRFLNDSEYKHMTSEFIEMIDEIKEKLDNHSFCNFLNEMGIPTQYRKMSSLTV